MSFLPSAAVALAVLACSTCAIGHGNLESSRLAGLDWVNFLAYDGNYVDMAMCWYKWFLKHASPQPLLIGCLDDGACAEAQRQLPGLQSRVKRVEVISLAEKYGQLLEPVPLQAQSNVSHVKSTEKFFEIKSQGALIPQAPLVRRQGRAAAASDWPRPTYINMYHRMIYDTMVQQGKSVLHVDVDALWLQKPDEMLWKVIEDHSDAAIIVSRSCTEDNPVDLKKKWGFVLNVGFIMYRNTEKTLELFQKDLLPAKEQSCQQLLNYALDRKGCRWEGGQDEHKVGWCGNIKVVALREADVSRDTKLVYKSDTWHPIISHPDTGKLKLTGMNRMKQFKDMHLCTGGAHEVHGLDIDPWL